MNHYKAIKINGKKKDLHRFLMEQKLGRPLLRSEVVHHIDGNKLNNDINNLELMSLKEHSKMHMTDRNFSESTSKKISLSHFKNSPHRMRVINEIEEIKKRLFQGENQTLLAIEYGVPRGLMCNIKNGKSLKWCK